MSCLKCNGTGLIPFLKEGKVIPNAFEYCECRQDEEGGHQPKPRDFDFPCSYDFRSFIEQELTGRPLPAIELPEEGHQPLLEKAEPQWVKEQWQYVQQLRAMVNHLNNKVTEMRAKRKPRGKY